MNSLLAALTSDPFFIGTVIESEKEMLNKDPLNHQNLIQTIVLTSGQCSGVYRGRINVLIIQLIRDLQKS